MGAMNDPKAGQAPGGQQPLLRAHMPELDTIRGLAILGVVFYHGFYWARDLNAYSSGQRTFPCDTSLLTAPTS
jgi:hypothetical protein